MLAAALNTFQGLYAIPNLSHGTQKQQRWDGLLRALLAHLFAGQK